MTTQPLSPIDISPTLKMYMEFIELSKRNYENFLKSASLRANGMDGKKAEVESITSPNDAAMLNWQKSGEEIFKRFVQNQMELCHFFGHSLGAVSETSRTAHAMSLIDRVGRTAVCVPEQVCERLPAGGRKTCRVGGEAGSAGYAACSASSIGQVVRCSTW